MTGRSLDLSQVRGNQTKEATEYIQQTGKKDAIDDTTSYIQQAGKKDLIDETTQHLFRQWLSYQSPGI